ncbi:PAS domain-containing sensor histidine kinase [Bacillus subtilis]|uniref:PAS domain-containing sensor histidine kinase n=1 Tax=Pseudochrobactrum asaccharolyticum TaxID=354351 RepID=UPI001F289A21|nr:PAS domain-containing sensor histidine kinase [Pseudochrobactrum asaccharolyticum]MCF7647109.1 PAS domain-containing sensor histidine kinase [Pseudochrobactrum asaccharolyticum]MCF7673371.1 PAS domain-containing sensor histidine kinase [Bacillus subtilis]
MKMIKGGMNNAVTDHNLLAQSGVKAHISSKDEHFSASDLRPALLLFPLFLAMAFYSIFPSISLNALLVTALSFTGVSVLMLAAQASGIRNSLTGIVALSFYSAILGFIALFAGADNALVWAMVLALPLELWLVTRHRAAVMAGGVIVAALIALSQVKGVNTQLALPAGVSTTFLFIYAGALLMRVLRVSVAASVKTQQPDHGHADSDLEAALDALVIRLDQDGHIRSLSDRCVEQFGVDRVVLNGTLLLDRVHVADRVQYLAFLDGLKHGKSLMKLSGKTEIRLRCVEAADVTKTEQPKIYFNVFEIEGQAKSAVGQMSDGFLIVARNIAQEQAVQQQIMQQSTVIENLETSRGRLLGTVSHELRTPLNSIIGFSDLLLHDVAGPLQSEKQREYIDLIRKSGNHLLEVVNGILEASRVEAGQYPVQHERFSVRDSVTMCSSMLMPLAEKKGVILCDRIHPDVTDMIADRRAIRQILINLVSNAIKFTDRGGCVTIEVMPDMMKQTYAGAQQNLVISVSDTGIGLEAHEIERLCQPFSQINNTQTRMQEGSGLGLYVVKGLVSLHQGEMDIRSRKGQGTTVSVTLPQSLRQQVVDNGVMVAGQAANQAPLQPMMQAGRVSTDIRSALEQVKTAIINLQADETEGHQTAAGQAESSYDGKTEPQRYETQGDFHAQKRKTA